MVIELHLLGFSGDAGLPKARGGRCWVVAVDGSVAAVAAAGRRVDRVEGELGRRLERGFEELEEIHSAAAAAAAREEAAAAKAAAAREAAAAAAAVNVLEGNLFWRTAAPPPGTTLEGHLINTTGPGPHNADHTVTPPRPHSPAHATPRAACAQPGRRPSLPWSRAPCTNRLSVLAARLSFWWHPFSIPIDTTTEGRGRCSKTT